MGDTKGSEIIKAVAKAMGEMKRIAKDSRNQEQKYDFASVDDFLAMTGPVCAANGIVTILNEVEVEGFERQGKYGPTNWLKIVFEIHTMHASGESLPVSRRTVEVIRTGAQSFGSAQSYVLKQYQRALYQIPTGDKDDADFAEKGEGAVVKHDQRKDDTADRAKHDRAVDQAIAYIGEADSVDTLKQSWMNLPTAMKEDGRVIKAKDDRKAALTKNADLDGDNIPYEGK